MRLMRTLRMLALALPFLTLALPGASRAKDREEPTLPRTPLRVAVMPIMNVTQEPLADQIVNQALQAQLSELDSARGTFLFSSDVQRVLSAHNQYYRAFAIAERWSKDGTLDSTAVDGIDTLLTVDAVLCARTTEWEVKHITVINAGQSYTTIGIQFALFDARTKNLLWKKDARLQRLAPEYDVSSGTVSYDATGTIRSRTTNEPPRPKDVANDLIRSAFKKFPTS
jgi:hypothetical protein